MTLTPDEQSALETLCRTFINDQHIYTDETIFQSDHIIENAYDLIAEICKIIGYCEFPDELADEDD